MTLALDLLFGVIHNSFIIQFIYCTVLSNLVSAPKSFSVISLSEHLTSPFVSEDRQTVD